MYIEIPVQFLQDLFAGKSVPVLYNPVIIMDLNRLIGNNEAKDIIIGFSTFMLFVFLLMIFRVQSCRPDPVMSIGNIKRVNLLQNFLELLHFQTVVNFPHLVADALTVIVI